MSLIFPSKTCNFSNRHSMGEKFLNRPRIFQPNKWFFGENNSFYGPIFNCYTSFSS